jgi:hypothetical protein
MAVEEMLADVQKLLAIETPHLSNSTRGTSDD